MISCQRFDLTYFLLLFQSVLDNGDIEVGVHIADVTHFVPHNSPLDMEARIRGTTFYLVDRRFDMLPSLLSSGKPIMLLMRFSVEESWLIFRCLSQTCARCMGTLID